MSTILHLPSRHDEWNEKRNFRSWRTWIMGGTELAEYKEGTIIYFKTPWEYIITTISKEKIDMALESAGEWIRVNGETINKNTIGRIKKFKIGTTDEYILWLPLHIREKVMQREKIKKERIGKGFRDIEEINNFMKNQLGFTL